VVLVHDIFAVEMVVEAVSLGFLVFGFSHLVLLLSVSTGVRPVAGKTRACRTPHSAALMGGGKRLLLPERPPDPHVLSTGCVSRGRSRRSVSTLPVLESDLFLSNIHISHRRFWSNSLHATSVQAPQHLTAGARPRREPTNLPQRVAAFTFGEFSS